MVIGFAKMEGHTVGVIGNNPLTLAGCLDINASTKAGGSINPIYLIPYLCYEYQIVHTFTVAITAQMLGWSR